MSVCIDCRRVDESWCRKLFFVVTDGLPVSIAHVTDLSAFTTELVFI